MRFLAVRGADLHIGAMQRIWWLTAALLAACASAPRQPASAMLAGAVAGAETRLIVSGDRIVSVVTPIDPRALPAAVRAACDAEAAGGRMTFCGEERGEGGRGYRVEKQLSDPYEHQRSLLVTERGEVVERRRTLPLARAPKAVLATALTKGAFVERVEIVAGPGRDEHWAVVVKDRAGETFAVEVALDGSMRRARRRTTARVDS